MKPASRQSFHTLAVLAVTHFLLTSVLAFVAVSTTDQTVSEFFALWLAMVLTWPLMIISALVAFVGAIIFGRKKSGPVVPTSPSSFFDDRRDDTSISMTGQPMNNGYDRDFRAMGMHDD